MERMEEISDVDESGQHTNAELYERACRVTQAFPVFPLPCIILNANRRTKTGEAWERGYQLLVTYEVYLRASFTTGNCCSSFLSTADGTATPAPVQKNWPQHKDIEQYMLSEKVVS